MKKIIITLLTFSILLTIFYILNNKKENYKVQAIEETNKYGIICEKNNDSLIIMTNEEIFEEIKINNTTLKLGQAIKIFSSILS